MEVLYELEGEGVAVHLDGRGWFSPRREGWLVGTLSMTRKGFSFVRPAQEDPKGDVFIPPRKQKDAHDGDLVLVKTQKPRRKGRPSGGRSGRARNGREGRVIHVLRRSPRVIVGIFYPADEGGGFVETLRHETGREIYVEPGRERGATSGDRVLARLVEGPSREGCPPGEVVDVLEEEGSWQADLQFVVAEHGLRREFPAAALQEAADWPAGLSAAEIEDRRDHRELPVFTIDPSDAKDFDDAICLQSGADGKRRIGVFIADVSHFVPRGSEIDREAYERGTSVYLPGLTIPMLPERLSDDLCSLRPGEDRLVKAVWLEVTPEGELEGWSVEKAVIRSHFRFAYHEVQQILEGKPAPDGAETLVSDLLALQGLAERIRARRLAGGSLDLDLPEMRILLDEAGEVLDIVESPRDDAHRLIEELMLLANEAVARTASERKIAILRRAHAPPPEEDVEIFLEFCRALVPDVRVESTADFPALVERVRDRPVAPVLGLALLRTLTKAQYEAEPTLHFALAKEQYCHFTSPIRRYPDLQVHRALDEQLLGADRAPGAGDSSPALEEMAARCSETERRAEEAERDMKMLRAISWLRHREGERFSAVVTAVLDFGFFARLDGVLVEGLVPLAQLRDDYYVLQERSFALRGRHTGRSFQVGDAIEVELTKADPLHRSLTLRYLHHRGKGRK